MSGLSGILHTGRDRWIALAVLLWVAAWVWIGRYALLDDALIHLRYAHGLAATGFLTFDGVTPTYGASSPLYVAILAALTPLTPGALLVKAVSVTFYLALLVLIARRAGRGGTEGTGWILLGLTLLGPMALRWLTDGMETSLALLLSILVAGLALDDRPVGAGGAAAAFALGLAAVLTRIELSLAIFFAVLGALPVVPIHRLARRHVPLAAGGLGGLALLYVLFGHVLPDTAIAKQTVAVPFRAALYQAGRSTASSLTLGAGLTVLWAGSLVLAFARTNLRGRLALLGGNLLAPCLVAAIAARGQILHGVRHLLWAYAFLIAWNVGILGLLGLRRRTAAPLPAGRWRRPLLAGLAVLVAVAWAAEGTRVASILRARNRMLVAMRNQPLARLRPATGAGFDIGFVSFFTGARILDFSGLVNGREMAALPGTERQRRMMEQNPDFLFVTGPQAAGLAPLLPDLDTYRVCYRYRSPSLTGEDMYLLAARPVAARRLAGARADTVCIEPLGRAGLEGAP